MLPPIAPLTPISPASTTQAAGTSPASGSGSASGAGFGNALQGAVEKLGGTLQQATDASQALATGQAQDVSSVVMAVERANLELQLATQVRNKAVEAYQEIFRMSV